MTRPEKPGFFKKPGFERSNPMEDRETLQQRLEMARRTLATLEVQAAGYTSLTIPAHLVNELEAKRQEVDELKARLGALGAGGPGAGGEQPLDRVRLRQNLVTYFDLDELRTLCFDLGIEHENLPGTKEGMARELVRHCERHGRTAELVATCRRLRPRVAW
jgi:hypothetical protein